MTNLTKLTTIEAPDKKNSLISNLNSDLKN